MPCLPEGFGQNPSKPAVCWATRFHPPKLMPSHLTTRTKQFGLALPLRQLSAPWLILHDQTPDCRRPWSCRAGRVFLRMKGSRCCLAGWHH